MIFPDSIVIALAALLVEGLVGYPDWLFQTIGHPVTWIGRAIDRGERLFNKPELDPETRRVRGFGLVAALLLVVAAVAWAVAQRAESLIGLAMVVLCASTLLAQRSLHGHVSDVARALGRSLDEGRAAVAKIVGRNVEKLDDAGVARAAIESLAENFSDGIVAPTFWLAAFGLPGAAVYKAVNTADSMIGHRSERYRAFGFAAAKIDDAANWPAARLAAILIVAAAALGRTTSARQAWRVMRRDAEKHASPNAGWPESAMAGALGVRLGGPRAYGAVEIAGVWLGDGGASVDRATVGRALALYRRALALQFVVLALIAVVLL